jgi:hypothetical protein
MNRSHCAVACLGSQYAANRLPTYCQQAANMLPTYCQQAANRLPTGCQQATNILPTGCQHAANILPTCCQQAANILPTGCQHTANRLPTCCVVAQAMGHCLPLKEIRVRCEGGRGDICDGWHATGAGSFQNNSVSLKQLAFF